MNLSQLVEASNPFGDFIFTETPLAPDPNGGHFLALGHAVQRFRTYLQQLSGFLESQKTWRIISHGGQTNRATPMP